MIARTLDEAAKAISTATGPLTVEIVGTIASLPLKYRKPDLTLDLTQATITGDSGTTNVDGLTILGGTFTGTNPLRFTGGRNIKVQGARFKGPETRLGNAMSFAGIDGLTALDCDVHTFLNGLLISDCRNIEASRIQFRNMRRDAISNSAIQNGLFEDIDVRDTVRLPDDHSDAGQSRNLIGKPVCSDLTFRRWYVEGQTQGIIFTHKAGDGGFDRITVEDCVTRCAFPIGIALLAVRGARLKNNRVSTWPESPYPSSLYVAKDCTDVVFEGFNTADAYMNTKAVSLPPTVVLPPPPPADPRDVRVAELELALALATSAATQAGAEAKALAGELTAALARIEAAKVALN
jgi:polygalacturonase